jgi:hypothetical protein
MKPNLTYGIRALLITVALTAAAASGQEQSDQAIEGEASTNCFSTHTLGKLRVCISEHGNVVKVESPLGVEHIRVGVIREGYAICAATSPFVVPAVSHDAGSSEGGFGAVVSIVQPVPNAFPLTITRTTTSGLQFIQSFSGDSVEGDLTILMTVRNLSGATKYNVRVDRYFDGDINATAGGDLYARTLDSVWGYENNSNGIMLRDIQLLPATPHTTSVQTFGGHVPASCNQASVVTPTAAGDFVGRLSYFFGTMAANASKSVRVNYARM